MTPALRICRLSLAACAAVGVFMMIVGIFVIPMLPHFQLDRVLTPQELLDPQTRQATLELLKKANGNAWLFWCGAGLAVVVSAGIGLSMSTRRAESSASAWAGREQ